MTTYNIHIHLPPQDPPPPVVDLTVYPQMRRWELMTATCPECHARPLAPCVKGNGNSADKPHKKRWLLSGYKFLPNMELIPLWLRANGKIDCERWVWVNQGKRILRDLDTLPRLWEGSPATAIQADVFRGILAPPVKQ